MSQRCCWHIGEPPIIVVVEGVALTKACARPGLSASVDHGLCNVLNFGFCSAFGAGVNGNRSPAKHLSFVSKDEMQCIATQSLSGGCSVEQVGFVRPLQRRCRFIAAHQLEV